MKKVVKFGGSSLASAEQFTKVGNIILADEARRYVVPSAPGKRFSDDTKVTDMLYRCYDLAEKGQAFTKQLNQIKDRYNFDELTTHHIPFMELDKGMDLAINHPEEAFKVMLTFED